MHGITGTRTPRSVRRDDPNVAPASWLAFRPGDAPVLSDRRVTVFTLGNDTGSLDSLQRLLTNVCGVRVDLKNKSEWTVDSTCTSEMEFRLIFLTVEEDAKEAARLIREVRTKSDADPIVVVSTRRDPYSAAQVMQAGADAYVIQDDLTLVRFQKAMQDAVISAEVRKQQAKFQSAERRTSQIILEQNQRLIRQSRLDSLTGLLNHAAIMRALETNHDAAVRLGKSYCIFMIDIDYFKRLNDSEGHMAGDEILKQVARCLEHNMRVYDSIGRYGGEEFLMLLPNIQLEDSQTLARHKCRELQSLELPHPDSPVSSHVTVSMGLSMGPATTGWQDVLKHADEAMYEAKRLGRNQVVVWNEAGLTPCSGCDADGI